MRNYHALILLEKEEREENEVEVEVWFENANGRNRTPKLIAAKQAEETREHR